MLFAGLLFFTSLPGQLPAVYLWNAQQLAIQKKKFQQKDKEVISLVDTLEQRAQALLSMRPVSVMDKAFTPASGSKHDYMSQAPYFWYDSTKPNGLPYLRRDGVRNPEINKITDHKSLDELESASRILSLAWYFTGKEDYAAKAVSLLRVFFINVDTKMNPNLDYAQGIPGITNGRGIGIIETRSLTTIANAIGLLAGAKSLTPTDIKSLKQWYARYLDWLLTSKNGKEENAAKNNHGVWFSVQVVGLALFTGDMAKAKQLAQKAKSRIDSQVDKEGKMPLELERTNALSYTNFNLEAWFDLAILAQHAGVDLWQYRNKEGAGIQTALDWFIPYALGEKQWPYQQIGHYNNADLYPILLQAACIYTNNNYLEPADKVKKNDFLYKLLSCTTRFRQ